MPSNYFFLHIPKTAGTSFRKSLIFAIPEERVFPNRFDLIENNGKYPPVNKLDKYHSEGKFNEINLFQGHYNYEVMQKYFPGAKVLCFFREPIDRAISNLIHLSRLDPAYKDMAIEEIAGLGLDRPNPQILNLQTRMSKNVSFEEKLKQLEDFEFIGISEMYNESIDLCNYTFGWKIPNNIKENISPDRPKKISKELLDFLILHNRQDMAIYTKAKWIFKERYQKYLDNK